MTTTLIASPRKLATGAWGAYCADAKVGDVVTVRTAGGKEWQARVTSVAGGVCTTASMDRAAATPAPRAANYDAHKFNGYGAKLGGYRRACKTDGNCSSFGSGRSCGGHDCDGE